VSAAYCLKNALKEKQRASLSLYSGNTTIGRTELNAPPNLISEADLSLETTPLSPHNLTCAVRENLNAVSVFVYDLIGQAWPNAPAIMGRDAGDGSPNHRSIPGTVETTVRLKGDSPGTVVARE